MNLQAKTNKLQILEKYQWVKITCQVLEIKTEILCKQ